MVEPVAGAVAGRFRDLTGDWPEGVWRAPGRVNLIGEHTDYNGGLALPFAIDRATVVAVRRRPDRRMRCWSSRYRHPARVDLDAIDRASVPAWARYPVGVLWAFARAGMAVPGLDMVVDSTVPSGGGLSSSAALEAAVAVALNDLSDAGLDRWHLVELCHAAESEFVGAPVGRLDQLAVLLGRADHGLLVDFRSFAVEEIPLGTSPLVVVDTRVRHRTAAGGYAARRRSCQQAAEQLGVAQLRDATVDRVRDQLHGELLCRARHVVSENVRVVAAAERLRCGLDIGALMLASHASLRDDFDVSCPELDLVVRTAAEMGPGSAGARLTGAGFGGCAIVVGRGAPELTRALSRSFSRARLRRPEVFGVVPSAGAGRLA